jgi:hypothetical protein
MYREADLGEVLAKLDYKPPGCVLYALGASATAIGAMVVALVVREQLRGGAHLDSAMWTAVGAALVFILPGVGISWSAWRRSSEHLSYVLHEIGLVRRARRAQQTFRWVDVVKITCIRAPSPMSTFVLETRAGDTLEMASTAVHGIGPDTEALLAKLTGVEIETIPAPFERP